MTSQMSMPEPVGELGELVDQRDVDRAEDVLEQLRELRRLGAGDPHHLLADQPVDLGRALRAGVGQPADDLRRVGDRVIGAPRVDALGRVGEVEVRAGAQARGLEQRQQDLAGGPRVGRRLQDDGLPPREHPGDGRGRRAHVGEIRLALVGKRRGDADQDRVAAAQGRRLARRGQAPAERRQRLGGDVLDVALPRGEPSDALGVVVEADDVDTRLAEGEGERQAHVAEADDPDAFDVRHPAPV